MEPNAFVAEVYRRMSQRHHADRPKPSFAEFQYDSRVSLAVEEYAGVPRKFCEGQTSLHFLAGKLRADNPVSLLRAEPGERKPVLEL